ncbi:MAG: phage portal protein [Phycisphaeraceae bacterium]|nr:MAG: phage portal protein [Phycisphaeraceae bacterium]
MPASIQKRTRARGVEPPTGSPSRDEHASHHGLDPAFIAHVIDEHRRTTVVRLERLWAYYRNALAARAEPSQTVANAVTRAGRWYTLAQEVGLPQRIVGTPGQLSDDRARARREAVIENDIAWRIHLMVDFMAGRPVTIASTAPDDAMRTRVERVLNAIWEASGGITLIQDMALLGHVYGHVDLMLRIDEGAIREVGSSVSRIDESVSLDRIARAIRIELIEPTRGIPITSPTDYRVLDAYLIHVEHEDNAVDCRGMLSSLTSRSRPASHVASRRRVTTLETMTPGRRIVEQDGRVVLDERSLLLPDVVPVVHVQNTSQPFRYTGVSEVEPLIPLQDELNTRLSDRACRVTMQSFNMYLAKGIEGFDRVPVGPGQVWSTDNPDAEVTAFGGDASSPSEDAHIEQIREAMDKTSAVPPLAGGVVRARIGNLSSANALRITLMSLLAKTARKRLAYGRGIAELNTLILRALDSAGVLRTSESGRVTEVRWQDPLGEIAGESDRETES